MSSDSTCPHCGRKSIYRTDDVPSAGGHGPKLLPSLGGIFISARFMILVCADCGLTRFFADAKARSKLSEADKWTRVM